LRFAGPSALTMMTSSHSTMSDMIRTFQFRLVPSRHTKRDWITLAVIVRLNCVHQISMVWSESFTAFFMLMNQTRRDCSEIRTEVRSTHNRHREETNVVTWPEAQERMHSTHSLYIDNHIEVPSSSRPNSISTSSQCTPQILSYTSPFSLTPTLLTT
jgi:hypothetical protein